MISDCYSTMKNVLDFLGRQDVGDDDIRQVVENSRFEKMKQRDLNYVPGSPSFFAKAALRDETKHFLREGKVGGWKKHLTVYDSEKIDRYLHEDESFFKKLHGLNIL